MVTSGILIGNLTFVTSSLLSAGEFCMLVLWKSRTQYGNLLHHDGTWEESLVLNGPNAAGVCVAGSEPL